MRQSDSEAHWLSVSLLPPGFDVCVGLLMGRLGWASVSRCSFKHYCKRCCEVISQM